MRLSYILTIFLDVGTTLVARSCQEFQGVVSITTKEECEETARTLGLPDTTADRISNLRYPPFCFYQKFTKYGPEDWRRGRLKFNTAAASKWACHRLRQCLCYDNTSKKS